MAFCPARGARRPAWRYPIVDTTGAIVGHKIKYADGLKPKERWDTAKAAHAPGCVYNRAGIIGAPTAFICEGPPDALLLVSLNLPACSLLCGTAAPRPEAIAAFKDVGVGRYIVAYDNDQPGRDGAVRATKALRAAGVRAHAIALPATLGDGGDVTDLYAAVGHDRDALLRALAACSPLALPLDAPVRPLQFARRDEKARDDFNRANDLVGLIASCGVRLTRVGVRHEALCPFHDEHTPSLTVYEDHYHCFGCGAHGDAYWFDREMQRKGGQARVSA